jgi:probable rRNA maturation factor
MRNIGIFNETQEKVENLEILEPLLTYALEVENVDNLEFNVIIINNEEIHKINKEYRGIDRPTDVISFALEDYKDIKYENDYRVLGDIYISIDKVKEQAKEYGHSEKRELAFLAVHGLLHLLGYDHMEKEDEKVMFSKQELILDGYGITK